MQVLFNFKIHQLRWIKNRPTKRITGYYFYTIDVDVINPTNNNDLLGLDRWLSKIVSVSDTTNEDKYGCFDDKDKRTRL